MSVRGFKAGYNGTSVLNGVDFDLNGGEIVSLVGRNGSGRSTMMQALLKIVAPTIGDVVLNGNPITDLKTYQIVRAGLSYVPEERLVFHNLNVRENLTLGIQRRPKPVATWHPDEFWSMFPNLAVRRGVAAGALSGGEQQMLTICRSLLGNPDAISNRVAVMGHGRIVYEGKPEELRARDDVRRKWLEV